jgi:2-oxoglutarate dehydrogenase E2 component (dihydrolipoamide succinyltransferase)
VGEFVKQDEEVATIETDKVSYSLFFALKLMSQIDVSVNAPMSGKIVELLADEDATVAVGQDLFRIEPGEDESSGSGEASSSPKSEEKKEEEPKKEKKESKEPAPKASEEKPAPKKEEKPAPKPAAKEEKRPEGAKSVMSRNETRVGGLPFPSH